MTNYVGPRIEDSLEIGEKEFPTADFMLLYSEILLGRHYGHHTYNL